MHARALSRRRLLISAVVAGLVMVPAAAAAVPVVSYDFAGPLFGLATSPDGSLLVADAGAGIVELRKGEGNLVVELPGVTDVAPIGRGAMFAVTGAGDWRLYRVSRGQTEELADLLAFEEDVNPDGNLAPDGIDSNPFDVEALTGGQALVADAGGNSILIIDQRGNVDWVATLPMELVSTANAKSLFGCPAGPPDICGLPAQIPAQAVATSVAIGPDGAYYVGELKGFPGPLGESQIWRIVPGTLHAQCGISPACTQVLDDELTSIVDLTFGPDWTLYATEIDEGSWFAVEVAVFFGAGLGVLQGGTVNACDVSTGECDEVANDLTIPIASAVDRDGNVFVAVNALLPTAEVIALP